MVALRQTVFIVCAFAFVTCIQPPMWATIGSNWARIPQAMELPTRFFISLAIALVALSTKLLIDGSAITRAASPNAMDQPAPEINLGHLRTHWLLTVSRSN